jgi:TPR repeat protein
MKLFLHLLLVFLVEVNALEQLTYDTNKMSNVQKEALNSFLYTKHIDNHVSSLGEELRKGAVQGLYDKETQQGSVHFLTALGVLTQNSQALVDLADYWYMEELLADRAVPLYQYAVALENPQAILNLSRIYLDSGSGYYDKESAHKLLLFGGKLNDDNCLCFLAQHYLKGTFGRPDPNTAFRIFQKSAGNNFMVGITESAVLLKAGLVFNKPDPVHAYELVQPHQTDNRAAILAKDLQKNLLVQQYIQQNYLKIAELYATGSDLPVRLDRAKYFIERAYQAKQIGKGEKKFYEKIIDTGDNQVAFRKPSNLDLLLIKLF